MNQIEKVARAIYDADRDGFRYDADTYEPMAKAAIAVMPVQAEPVAWQRRACFTRPWEPAGTVHQWQSCSKEEATGHFERQPGYEYRPLYAHPPAQWQGIESAGGSDAE